MFPGFILAIRYSIGDTYFEPSYHVPIVIISYVLSGLIPGILNPRRRGFINLISITPLVFVLILAILFHLIIAGWFAEEIELTVYFISLLLVPLMSFIGSLISPKNIESVFEENEKDVVEDTDEN